MSVDNVTLHDYNITVKVKKISVDSINNILAEISLTDGGIAKFNFEQFLIESLIEKDNDFVKAYADIPNAKVEDFRGDLLLAIYDINPAFDPSKLVIINDKVLRKGDALKNKNHEYIPLPLNHQWSTEEGDWRSRITNSNLVNELIEEIWINIINVDPDETYYKVPMKSIGVNFLPIEKVDGKVDQIIKSYIVEGCKKNLAYAKKSKYVYIGFLSSMLIPDSPRIFTMMKEAGYLVAYTENYIANQVYKAIIELNPSLKWETINWDKFKSINKDRKDKKEESADFESSKDAKENRLHFNNISHDEILGLKGRLKKRIIGQDPAIEELCDSINVARVGLRGDQKPVGSFLFVGTSGVGKTELSKVLADELMQNHIIKIDCSEYQSEHEVSKLFGSPPGYAGFEDFDVTKGKNPPATLASKIKKTPCSVVVFDEIEKAHEKVYNVLLQIMDEGVITSGRGDTCKFNEAVIILTSNVGTKEASHVCESNILGFGEDCRDFSQISKDIIETTIKDRFKPEFRNRLTKIITFNSLSKDVCFDIVEVLLSKLRVNLEKSQHSTLSWDSSVLKYICDEGYDDKFGARNLERTIDKLIALPLANNILQKHVPEKSKINLKIIDKQLEIDYQPLEKNVDYLEKEN